MATSYFLQWWPVSCHRASSSFQPVLAAWVGALLLGPTSPCRCSPAKLCANVKLRRKQSVPFFDLHNLFPHQLLALSNVPCTVCNMHRFERSRVVGCSLRAQNIVSAISEGLRTDLESVRGVPNDLLSQSCVAFCCKQTSSNTQHDQRFNKTLDKVRGSWKD